jgi:hypothetical protein
MASLSYVVSRSATDRFAEQLAMLSAFAKGLSDDNVAESEKKSPGSHSPRLQSPS